jgi:hypothetical protein
MKHLVHLVGAFVLLGLDLGIGIYLGSPGDWTAERRLRGKLARVGIQFDCWGVLLPPGSAWQGRWVWSKDPAFLARAEAWLQTLERPACESSFRQRGNRIMFVFADGRQEEMLFLGPNRPGPSAVCCYGFMWDGHGMSYGEEPFSEFLRTTPVRPVPGAGQESREK